ncbi:MAG: L,D-transpeptidase [Miltoncostaeaceae bacterium]
MTATAPPAHRGGPRSGTAAGRRLAVVATAVAVAVGAATAHAQDTPDLRPPAAGHIAEGVTISGIDVAGLTRMEARAKVLREHVAPRRERIEFRIDDRDFTVNPALAGYVAEVDYALRGAMNFGRTQPLRQVDVPLRERINGQRVRRILDWHEGRVAPEARDARRVFEDGVPRITQPRIGHELRQPAATRVAARAIIHRTSESVSLPTRRVIPETRVGFAVVIDRSAFQLHLYRAAERMRTMPVGVGMASHPTPAGQFRVVNMERNPTWNPPDSRWAEGIGPIPPGPENPLGTRWIGIDSPAIGIHGTPEPETVGRRSSHGCIRMYDRDARWLYNLVRIGTPVVIR